MRRMADTLAEYLKDAVGRFRTLDPQSLLEKRYAKFRKIGLFSE